MRAVVAIWRAGSVSAAARQLHLTQGAVSSRLKAAEAAVGCPLFVRQPRGMEATEVCDHLVRQVLSSLDVVERAWTEAVGSDDSDVTVHVGGPSDFLSELVLPALTQHRVMVRFGFPDDLLPDVYAGALDLVVSTVAPRRSPADVESLFDEELLWVGHATAWDDGPWFAYHEGLPLISRYAKRTQRPTPLPSVIVPDLRALRTMLLQGVGTTVLPSYLVPPELPVLERPKEPATNTLWLVTGRHRAGNASVVAVADQIRRAVSAVS